MFEAVAEEPTAVTTLSDIFEREHFSVDQVFVVPQSELPPFALATNGFALRAFSNAGLARCHSRTLPAPITSDNLFTVNRYGDLMSGLHESGHFSNEISTCIPNLHFVISPRGCDRFHHCT